MRRIRIYVDTSVFGGILDDEFAEASKRFFEAVHKGKYRILVSAALYGELEGAPAPVQQEMSGLPAEALEEINVDEEVQHLANAYVSAGILRESALQDALHVAAATVAGADLVVSWNFRHIVNYDSIKKFNAVNLLKGYTTLDIRSPLEMAYAE